MKFKIWGVLGHKLGPPYLSENEDREFKQRPTQGTFEDGLPAYGTLRFAIYELLNIQWNPLNGFQF